jgi:hypothetical protein
MVLVQISKRDARRQERFIAGCLATIGHPLMKKVLDVRLLHQNNLPQG